MANLITIGKCNKLYIYICYYLIVQLMYEYLFDGNLPKEIKIEKLDPSEFPKNILIQETFNYLGIFIFSIIFYKYEKLQNSRKTINNIQQSLNLNDIKYSSSSNSIKEKDSSIQLIYYNAEEGNINNSNSGISIGFTCILLTISVQSMNQLYIMDLRALDFWMFEILFISFITLFMFGKRIYKHKKLAIAFITLFPSLFKSLSIYEIVRNDNEKNIYKVYKWIIPLGIIIFFLLTFLRDYSICKIKWFLEYEFFSPNIILILYSIWGFIICFISSIISTFIKCNSKFEYITFICTVDTNNKNEEKIYYYDNFKIYFKDLWKENRSGVINFLYILLIFFKILIFYLIKLFSILIIKKLNQVYLICSTSIFYFVLRFMRVLFSLILKNDKSIYVKFYELLAEFFSIIGIIFYLELIEFNFCGLNYDLKKNITIRSIDESYISSLVGDDLNESLDDQNMTELKEV